MTDTDIKKHYNKGAILACIEVKKEARRILRLHPEFDEFIMSMGSCFFTQKNNEHDHVYPSELEEEELSFFLGEWDDIFRITGNSTRFTANGIEINKW